MYNKDKLIRNLCDYVLLNAYAVEMSGLYNGKAGMALSLYKSARYLGDDYIEEQATELLKEALLSKTEDVGLENGLAGIGYVLLYLIKCGFIDADFDDIFAKQHEKIARVCYQRCKDLTFLLNTFPIVYYWCELLEVKGKHEDIQQLIKAFLKSKESYFINNFNCFNDTRFRGDKYKVTCNFEYFLKTLWDCRLDYCPHEVLSLYTTLLKCGYAISTYNTNYYLNKINFEKKVLNTTKSNYICPPKIKESLTIRETIQYSQISGTNIIDEILKNKTFYETEGIILKKIPSNSFIAGYEQGVGRLLCYLANPNSTLI